MIWHSGVSPLHLGKVVCRPFEVSVNVLLRWAGPVVPGPVGDGRGPRWGGLDPWATALHHNHGDEQHWSLSRSLTQKQRKMFSLSQTKSIRVARRYLNRSMISWSSSDFIWKNWPLFLVIMGLNKKSFFPSLFSSLPLLLMVLFRLNIS